MATPTAGPIYVIACFPWTGTQENQLTLEADEIYQVVLQTENGWARGIDMNGNEGFFPSSFVKACSPEQVQQLLQNNSSPSQPDPVEEQTSQQTTETVTAESSQSVNTQEPEPSISESTPAKKPKRETSSKRVHSVKKEDDSIDGKKKRKKSKGSSGTDRSKRRKKRTEPSTPTQARSRRGTAHTLRQFEQKSRGLELSWSKDRIGSKPIKELLQPPTELKECLDVVQKFDSDIAKAINAQNLEEAKKLLDGYPSAMEGCEWGVFEWHQLLKGKWEARRDTSNTQIEVTLGHLDRLVKLQQARCFDPEQVENDIETLLNQIREQQLIELPSRTSTTQLDEFIERFRQKAATERENSSIAEKKASFYDMLADKVNVAVCHMTLCHFFTVVLAAATTIEDSQPTPDQLHGYMEDIIVELLHTSISLHKMEIPFAGVLSKLVTSWGALNPHMTSFVTKDSSLTELFSQQLAYEFTRVYSSQLELLSVSASHLFARAAISRMISIVANGHLDLTRPVVEQLIAKLQVTVLPGHAKPVNGATQLLIRGSQTITVDIPTDLQTQAYRQEQLEQYRVIVDGNAPSDIKATPQYTEAEIILRSGWEVVPPSPGIVYKLSYPRHSFLEELSFRQASEKIAHLLIEMGWFAPSIIVPKEVAPEAPKNTGGEGVGGLISDSDWNDLKDQVQSQRQLITQQTSALNHMNQLIKSLQQQLQTEKVARQEIETKLDSLANQSSSGAMDRAISPTFDVPSTYTPEQNFSAPMRETAPMPPPRASPSVPPRNAAPSIPSETNNIPEEFLSEESEETETASASYSDF